MGKQEKRVKELREEVGAEAQEVGTRRWSVGLPGNPTRSVTAADEAGAIEAYRREMGIVATEHAFCVDGGGER